ncbi:DUF2845 domain-containing protein [Legionella sp.]|uniref:DUF2845 domain-containing protein n=1 Tax=Legionella sp. TaxID=459 RepID=UPI003C80F1B7
MKLTFSIKLALVILPFSLFANSQSLYCPQNHAYINIGMTPDQVIAACGQPVSQQESNQPVTQKIPVQQLIYNNKGTTTVFYGVWNIPTGNGGAQLEINIVDRKVKSIKLNGSDSNAISICGGNNFQIGDPIDKVYYSCGSPSITNNTFINEIVPSAQKPQVWIFQPDQYQPSVTLTFVDGRLQSIN